MARIEGYAFGRVLVDGVEHDRDVIVLPNRVVADWRRRNGHALVLEDLDGVLEELPERLVVGTGAYGRVQPDPSTLDALRKRGVEASRPTRLSGSLQSSTRPTRPRRSTSPANAPRSGSSQEALLSCST